ncbi:hypothetical protein CS542_06275 [Pedobacter sp. IW39]|nr:hypothetical protein CS542_06275 [Pedobacter sp. IW39]
MLFEIRVNDVLVLNLEGQTSTSIQSIQVFCKAENSRSRSSSAHCWSRFKPEYRLAIISKF